MARTFADEIVESSQTLGTVAYDLDGKKGGYRPFRSGYSDGDSPYYVVRNKGNSKWEINRGGTLVFGTPDRLSRSVYKSTNNDAAVSWTTDDLPLTIYNTASADVAEGSITGWLGTVKHALLGIGAAWLDSSLVGVLKDKIYLGGDINAERGRVYVTEAIYSASQRIKAVDKGAANAVLTADDVGKLLEFDCTAGVRTLTMLANTAPGMGDGAYVFVRPYGSSTNGVTFIPGGADTTDLATAPPKRITRFAWSGALARWESDYIPPSDFKTGDVKLTLNDTADAGWILHNDGTIGDASSGATCRANSDTQALFNLIYAKFDDTKAPVSGGRTNAASDFAAHKTIQLPKALGRAIGIAGAGSGLTARTLGQTVGAEKHTLTDAENTVKAAGASSSGGGSPVPAFAVGAATAFDIMNPTTYLNAMIKL